MDGEGPREGSIDPELIQVCGVNLVSGPLAETSERGRPAQQTKEPLTDRTHLRQNEARR